LSVLFIIVGFFLKLALAPFHVWIADVYEGALTAVTAFFVIVPKIVLIFVLVFNLGFFVLYKVDLENFILVLSILSVLVGSLAALYQISVKRLIAYSAVVHMGFLFLGLALGTELALISVFVYLFIYIVVSVNFFSILLSLTNYVTMEEFSSLRNFSGLYRSHIVLGLIVVLNVFSFVGVPPLSGFFGKALVLLSMAETRLTSVLLLFIFASVVSAFYYLRIIKIFVYEVGEMWYFLAPIGRSSAYVITLFVFLNIFFMLYGSDVISMFVYLFV
jgi:NADH-quinone oxidoreductase subunit N